MMTDLPVAGDGTTIIPASVLEPASFSSRFHQATRAALQTLAERCAYRNALLVQQDDAGGYRVIAAVCATLSVRVGDRLSDLAPAATNATVTDINGRPCGMISLSDAVPGVPRADVAGWLEATAGQFSVMLAYEYELTGYRQSLDRLRHEALHDSLTELYNRRGWERALRTEEARCQRYQLPGGVIVIDLDGLKQINDRDGHAAGDLMIRNSARVLRRQARVNDVIARLGGDELGWLLVDADRAQTRAATLRVRRALSKAGVQASVGFATRQTHGRLQEAVRAADKAMYDDKRRRRQVRRPPAVQTQPAGVRDLCMCMGAGNRAVDGAAEPGFALLQPATG